MEVAKEKVAAEEFDEDDVASRRCMLDDYSVPLLSKGLSQVLPRFFILRRSESPNQSSRCKAILLNNPLTSSGEELGNVKLLLNKPEPLCNGSCVRSGRYNEIRPALAHRHKVTTSDVK
ncbi:unnamed protein product [Chrysodeixis includens]|uniref:Uncharacterized protein n=1 Tax=Chrysodeixis includens TaxID=689277 RepID=A0A9N8KSU8_CHRIL|nr:unnamed protein product [Chrysodeixis includens]